jgi:hypothetical protein
MDKNIIKQQLNQRFLSEASDASSTPGISMQNSVKKKSGTENKAGVKAIEKDMVAYDKAIKNDSEIKKTTDNKFNYNGDSEKEYHDQMEIMNGQEMLEYDRDPNEEFKKRAEEAIEGSSRMGNKGGKGMGNAEATWGASSDDFGKNLVKNIKASSKKRQDAVKGIISFGDDIETVPKNYAPMSSFSAFNESIKEKKNNTLNDNKNKTMKRLKFNQEFKGVGNALKIIPESYKVDNKVFEMTDGNESYKIRWEGTLSEGRAVVLTASDKNMVNENMAHMKHLMGYKSHETLGLVKGKSRLDENAAFNDIWNKSKLMIEGEDIEDQDAPEKDADKVVSQAPEAKKHVEGSVSTEKGTKAPKPKTGSMESLDDAKSQAPEAKKHVHMGENVEEKIGMGLGDQSEEEEEWDQTDMPQAAPHGNPSSTTYAPAPKTGEWDKTKVPQSSDAKKHVHMGEGIELGGKMFTKLNENIEEMLEEMEDEEIPANPEDYKTQPGYVHEEEEEESFDDDAEPTSDDLATNEPIDTPYDGGDEEEVEIPAAPAAKSGARLMVSQSTGEYFIIGVGAKPIPVPLADKERAKMNPAKYSEEMLGQMDDYGNIE